MKTAEDIVNDKGIDIIAVPANMTIYETIEVMVKNKTGTVLVAENEKLIGVWSERDLMRNITSNEFDMKTGRIRDYMAVGIPTVPHTYTAEDLMNRLHGLNRRHLIVEKDGKHLGLLTAEDIYKDHLVEKSKNYAELFEHVGCGVYISSKEGKFLDANPTMLGMLGYKSKEEFLNIDIARDLYLRPQDREKFMELIEKDGYVIDYEVDFKRKDGTPVSVNLTGHVRYDKHGNVIGYEGINVDQTQRKLMENQIKESHDFLNMTIQSSPNAVIAADMKGKMILWNQAANDILGYTAEDVIGKMNITEIYREGIAQKLMKMLRSQEHGGTGIIRSYPLVNFRRDGKEIECSFSAAVVYDVQGNEIATVGTFVDLKERLEMERKLIRTQEQLLQSEKLAAMGRLTSQIAHELNNPLYGIMNTLELMKTEIPPTSKRRKILEMALSETVRLTDMLRKMLSFSKPDQEKKQPTDINAVLDEILLINEKQLQENSIKIKPSLAKDLGMVVASKNQLRQVFLNMISNARDAMPEGGTLSVKTKADKKNINIEISDTGVGIEPKNIKKIFDTFFTTKDSVKGVGLGLSVCYGFIQDHGGDIEAQSEPGSGTTFTISLPLIKD